MSFSPNFSFWFLEVLVSNDMFPKVHLIQVLRVHDKFCSDSFRSWNLDMQQQKKHCIRIFYVIILTYGTNGDVDWKTCCWLSQRGQPRCSSVHRELRHSSKWRPVMETGRTQPNTSNVMVWPNSAEKTSNDYRPLHTPYTSSEWDDTNTKRPRVRDDVGALLTQRLLDTSRPSCSSELRRPSSQASGKLRRIDAFPVFFKAYSSLGP